MLLFLTHVISFRIHECPTLASQCYWKLDFKVTIVSSCLLQRLQWSSSRAHRELCYLKGRSEDQCQNYVRVFGRQGPDRFLVCGTNAYKPQCRQFTIKVSALYFFFNRWQHQGRSISSSLFPTYPLIFDHHRCFFMLINWGNKVERLSPLIQFHFV